jgi:glutamyl-tRNA reductase
MLDGFHILTITHRDAPLETISHVLVPDAGDDALHALKAQFGWDELLYLNTCNRVTYLFYTTSPVSAELPLELLEFIRPDLSASTLNTTAAAIRLLHGANAVNHLFEVASSMDSLVVGEREIVRQLREAYDRNMEWGLTGDNLRLLLRFTIETAKEIYTQTGIGEKALSVVALAFGEMIKSGLSTDARILMIGAGETNSLYAKFLLKYGFKHVTVFNRTLTSAQNLAEQFGGRAFPLDELEYYTEGFDALVVCTGATEAIITPEIYHKLLAADGSRKVVVDLSIPHNIDKSIPVTFPVQYIEIEGLRSVAQENLAHRERECIKARVILKRRLTDFREVWHERQIERALSHIPEEVKAVKEKAVQEVFGKEFNKLDAEAQDLVLRMLGYMEKKCVAIPMKSLKAIALKASKQGQPQRQV